MAVCAKIRIVIEERPALVPKNKKPLFLLIILVAGCNYPSAPSAPTVDLVSTAVAETLAAENQPTSSPIPDLLPHPVYFLSESSGSMQIWKLERDANSQLQITNEAFAVDSFDVSGTDGTVAYVSNNQLYLVNADGSNRRLLVDNAGANPEDKDYFFFDRIGDPLFSSDGKRLAYAFGGLWVLDISTNQAIQLFTNEVQESEGVSPPVVLYAPMEWAPDSAQILVSISDTDGSRIAILKFGEGQTLTGFENNGRMICCQAAWAPDSSSILVASPFIGLIEPGLWRFDATNGKGSELLGVTEEGMFQFAGWPLQLSDGGLRFFYTSSTEIPSGDLPLFMMRSDADGVNNRKELRPDSFSNIGEVLWAEDGSLALIVQLSPSGVASGPVVLAFSDDRQLQVLLPSAQNLKWGL